MTIRQDKSEYHAVQVGATDKPLKTTTRQMQGHFRKANVTPKRIVKEFPVTSDAHVPVGMCLVFPLPLLQLSALQGPLSQ